MLTQLLRSAAKFEEGVLVSSATFSIWAVKVDRSYYELCVLEKLERALKCKEVWVEGSHAFRNPGDDLPGDWGEENRRTLHYQELGKPVDAHTFVESLRERLTRALEQFNRVLPSVGHLRIFHPNKKEDRGLWALTKLEPQPEPQSVGLIKDEISNHYGMLDLLDVFVEADRLVDFTRFFTHSGTKEVRSRETLRPLLILELFAEGTNTGIKRVANANDRYSYEELLYVRKTYFSPEALRNANGAVVNKLLALRNEGPLIDRPADVLKVWPTRELIQWLPPAQFNPLLDQLVTRHCR